MTPAAYLRPRRSILLPIALGMIVASRKSLAFSPPGLATHAVPPCSTFDEDCGDSDGSASARTGVAAATSTATAATRADFLTAAAASGSAALILLTADPRPASARGRATLEASYDRYSPRIVEGGTYYKTDLRNAIAKSDFEVIKAATSEPPSKSKEGRKKIDGGAAERAAQAGGFSDFRVLSA